MGDAGSAGAQFDRAIKARNVIAALDAAYRIHWLSLGHALELLILISEKDAGRYPRAATFQ